MGSNRTATTGTNVGAGAASRARCGKRCARDAGLCRPPQYANASYGENDLIRPRCARPPSPFGEGFGRGPHRRPYDSLPPLSLFFIKEETELPRRPEGLLAMTYSEALSNHVIARSEATWQSGFIAFPYGEGGFRRNRLRFCRKTDEVVTRKRFASALWPARHTAAGAALRRPCRSRRLGESGLYALVQADLHGHAAELRLGGGVQQHQVKGDSLQRPDGR